MTWSCEGPIQLNPIQFKTSCRNQEWMSKEYNFLNVFITECINRSFHIQVQNVSVTERPPVHYSLQSVVLQKHLTNLLPPTVVSGQTFLGFPKPLPQFCHLQVPKMKAIINKQMAEDMKIYRLMEPCLEGNLPFDLVGQKLLACTFHS